METHNITNGFYNSAPLPIPPFGTPAYSSRPTRPVISVFPYYSHCFRQSFLQTFTVDPDLMEL